MHAEQEGACAIRLSPIPQGSPLFPKALPYSPPASLCSVQTLAHSRKRECVHACCSNSKYINTMQTTFARVVEGAGVVKGRGGEQVATSSSCCC